MCAKGSVDMLLCATTAFVNQRASANTRDNRRSGRSTCLTNSCRPSSTDARSCAQSMTPGEVSERPAKRSYVPEHVRRPRDFVCYTFEEPIVVGSGIDGASRLESAAAQAAAVAAGDAAARGAQLQAEEAARLGGQHTGVEAGVDGASPIVATVQDMDARSEGAEQATVPESVAFVPRAARVCDTPALSAAQVEQPAAPAGAGNVDVRQDAAARLALPDVGVDGELQGRGSGAEDEGLLTAAGRGRQRRRYRARSADDDDA
jgi:hypothetical protein